jgi:hypothetical protein
LQINKFNEWDKVEVINDWYISHYGKQGVIVKLYLGKDNKTYVYHVYFDGENCTLPITEDSLKIVNE